MYKKIILTIITTLSLQAHSLWVNAIPSNSPHKPKEPHIIISLGWGHTLPIGDSLNSLNGRIEIKDFDLIKPNGVKIPLKKPPFKIDEPIVKEKGFDLFDIDMSLHKIKYNKDSQEGVYQVVAKSVPTYYTVYIDNKDRKRFKLKPIDKLKNVKEVVGSFQYQAFGKSYIGIGKWKQPKPLGLGMEIIPLSDLSNVRVGDLVEFEVLFHGKKLHADPLKTMDYISAYSNSFGQSEHFALMAYLKKGKASFRVQSSGQWIVNIFHQENVTKKGSLKHLFGKTKSVLYGSTLRFNVK